MREDQEDSLSSVPSHYFNAFSEIEPEERKNFEKTLMYDEEIVEELDKNQRTVDGLQKWQDERRGFLSNKVHVEKYADDGISGFGAAQQLEAKPSERLTASDKKKMRGMDMQLRSSDSAAHSMHATQNLALQLGIRSARRPVLGLQLDPDEDEDRE